LNDWQSVRFDPPGGLGWLFVLLAIGAVVYAVYVYRRTDAPLPRATRTTLTVLRALFLLILLAILCRPVLSLAVASGADRGVLVLLDRSMSMLLPGSRDGERRLDEIQRVREGLEASLAKKYPVSMVPFAGTVGEPLAAEEAFGDSLGSATSLSGALEQGMAASGLSMRPGAVLLVSDGTQTEGPDPLAAARRLGVPVSTIPLGSDRPVRDLSLVRAHSNRDVFLGEATPVEAVLRLQGLEAAEVDVVLTDVTDSPDIPGASGGDPGALGGGGGAESLPNAAGGTERELARRRVTVRPGGAELRVPLSFTPEDSGLRFLRLSVSPLAGESTLLNNRRLLAMTVREEKTGVLLLSGKLTWDHTFLRRALEADSTLAVVAAYRRGGAFRSVDLKHTVPPLTEEGLRETRVVVLDHVTPGHLGPAGQEAIAGFVRGGGGLVVLTGSESGGLTAWRGSVLEALLPVSIEGSGGSREEQLRLAAGAARQALFDPSVPGAVPLETWSHLPPVTTAPGLGVLKGRGEALLTTSATAGNLPVVSWTPLGEGRVLFLAGGGFWSWDFRSAARGGGGDLLPAWWRRAAQWLSQPVIATRFEVHPDRRVVRRGETVRFTARATDQAYRPLPGVTVEVEVAPAAEPEAVARRLTLSGSEGFLSGVLGRLEPGRYRYRGTGRIEGETVGVVEGRFAVDSLGAEMERLEADHELLARLAAETGGKLWAPDSLGSLAAGIELVAAGGEERRQVDLWNHPLVFVLFVLVGSAEWILRRRRGLV